MTLGVFSALYDRVLRGALRLRAVTLLLAFGVFFVSVWSIRFLATELIPQLSEGEFFFEVKLPEPEKKKRPPANSSQPVPMSLV